MARIRSIKMAWWQQPSLSCTSYGARLLLLGMHNEADDAGRLVEMPKALAGVIFPHDEEVDAACVNEWLAELEAAGLIQRYEAGPDRVVQIARFLDFQKIDRPTDSAIPPHPREPSRALASPRESSAWIGEERKGEERIGVGEERARAKTLWAQEENHDAPKDAAELVSRCFPNPKERERIASLDGKQGRQTPEEVAEKLWPQFYDHMQTRGLKLALARAKSWILADATKVYKAFQSTQGSGQPPGPTDGAIARLRGTHEATRAEFDLPSFDEMRAKYSDLKRRKVDLPPFDDWLTKEQLAANRRVDLDPVSPEEVKQLVAKVLPGPGRKVGGS